MCCNINWKTPKVRNDANDNRRIFIDTFQRYNLYFAYAALYRIKDVNNYSYRIVCCHATDEISLNEKEMYV